MIRISLSTEPGSLRLVLFVGLLAQAISGCVFAPIGSRPGSAAVYRSVKGEAHGVLRLETEPSGASVTLESRDEKTQERVVESNVAVTPCTLYLRPNIYDVSFDRYSKFSYRLRLDVEEGVEDRIRLRLDRSAGQLGETVALASLGLLLVLPVTVLELTQGEINPNTIGLATILVSALTLGILAWPERAGVLSREQTSLAPTPSGEAPPANRP